MFYIKRWFFYTSLKRLLKQSPNQKFCCKKILVNYLNKKLKHYILTVEKIESIPDYVIIETALKYF